MAIFGGGTPVDSSGKLKPLQEVYPDIDPQYIKGGSLIDPYTGQAVDPFSNDFQKVAKNLQALSRYNKDVSSGKPIATPELLKDPTSPYYHAPPDETQISKDSRSLTTSYLRDFPSILEEIRKQIPEFERQQLQISKEVSPQYAAIQRELYGGNAAAAAEAERRSLKVSGPGVARQQRKQDQILNPQFYEDRKLTIRGLRDLLQPGLSGGESTAIERGLNRQFQNEGTSTLPIHSKEIESAINYGEAGRNRLTQALQAAIQASPTLRSPLTGYQSPKPGDISGAFQNVKGDIGKTATELANFNPSAASASLEAARIGKPIKPDSFSTGIGLTV